MAATWKYSAKISSRDQDYTRIATWSGFITDKVIDKKTAPDGKITFTIQESLQPPPSQYVWRQSGTFEYTLSGDGIFEGNSKIYQWPLSDKLTWKSKPNFGQNDMVANYIQPFSTPYGALKGCYTFLIQTNPDTTEDTFCPGVGFVEHKYSHHGTPQDEHLVTIYLTHRGILMENLLDIRYWNITDNISDLIKVFFDKIRGMTNKIKTGDHVYVSRVRAKLDINAPSAFFGAKVDAIKNRSAKVVLPSGDISEFIPTSAMIKQLGILVIQIGDFDTEHDLLEPLKESLNHYFRLLLSDGEVLFWSIRSLDELGELWISNSNHKLISHVILIGHGKENAIKFGKNWIKPEDINHVLNVDEATPKQFISLCCETGKSGFGKAFSQLPICESLIAPFQNIHGSIASQFCQTYFNYLLLQGKTPGITFNKARGATPNATSFRRWKNGEMTI